LPQIFGVIDDNIQLFISLNLSDVFISTIDKYTNMMKLKFGNDVIMKPTFNPHITLFTCITTMKNIDFILKNINEFVRVQLSQIVSTMPKSTLLIKYPFEIKGNFVSSTYDKIINLEKNFEKPLKIFGKHINTKLMSHLIKKSNIGESPVYREPHISLCSINVKNINNTKIETDNIKKEITQYLSTQQPIQQLDRINFWSEKIVFNGEHGHLKNIRISKYLYNPQKNELESTDIAVYLFDNDRLILST